MSTLPEVKGASRHETAIARLNELDGESIEAMGEEHDPSIFQAQLLDLLEHLIEDVYKK